MATDCASPVICVLYYVCKVGMPIEDALQMLSERKAKQVLKWMIAMKIVKRRGNRFRLAVDICKIYEMYMDCVTNPTAYGIIASDSHGIVFDCIKRTIAKTATQ